MRRSLAVAAVALAATTAAAPAATARPNIPPSWCDIAQNCVCLVVTSVLEAATGDPTLHCV
ncbi:MAG TPA: hypothetical protein VF519_12605 [Mycobacteriales bacterium]